MKQTKKEVAIVGAGISGIRSAYLIAKEAKDNIAKITIYESSDSIGGVLKNTTKNEFKLEHGAQGILLSRKAFWDCLSDLKLTDMLLIPPKSAKRRYLLTPNKFVPITPNVFVLKKNGFLRFRDLFKIFTEVFIKKPQNKNFNDTLYQFFFRHFGKKFTETFLVSLTFGIWGGGAKKILVRYAFPNLLKLENGYGSLLKAFLILSFKNKLKKDTNIKQKGLGSFAQGMEYLVHELYEQFLTICSQKSITVELNLNHKICKIIKISNYFSLESTLENKIKKQSFDCVVYSGQPWRDSNLSLIIDNINFEELQKSYQNLRSMEAHSVAVVGLGTNNENLNSPNGFGALAGEWSKDLLGVIFVHSTYPQHTPKNSKLFRVLIGGDREINISQKSELELIDLAKQRLEETNIVPSNTNYSFEKVIVWENYIPLATVNQDRILESIWKIEAIMPGLFFVGNYLKGPSVSDCLEQAAITCKNVTLFLDGKGKND
ncbi:protoporphyrinogen oxidase [Pigmentibacter sp. JX0631]|uniref:protoporphyrinogen oxidase n=1 Tax=Pigmentibacter sp. JX0631 TaxID=2976982 RepID=UPI00246848D1|nr:protoporphyrinogen oxidase [Pigmentibacter sp. JX0631]WGL59847.1 protoporphyrinogen oxidase [Pigmentibacter sp. JX0631]